MMVSQATREQKRARPEQYGSLHGEDPREPHRHRPEDRFWPPAPTALLPGDHQQAGDRDHEIDGQPHPGRHPCDRPSRRQLQAMQMDEGRHGREDGKCGDCDDRNADPAPANLPQSEHREHKAKQKSFLDALCTSLYILCNLFI